MQESKAEIENVVVNSTFQFKENINLSIYSHEPVASRIDTNEVNKEKRKVWKSLLVLCVAMALGFSSGLTLANSITSLFPNGNLGISAFAVSGASQVANSAFFSSASIKLWGCLKMFRIGLVINMLFVVVFFYPNWYTLMIGSFFFGISYSVLIASGYMYTNSAGYWLARITNNSDVGAILARVAGIMTAAFGSSFIWGNIALYLILGSPLAADINISQDLCGAGFCNQELNLTSLQPLTPVRYYSLIGVLTTISMISFGLTFFLEDFSDKLGQVCCTKSETWTAFLKTWKLFKNPNGYLLMPITFTIAMEEAFVLVDFTEALVGCSLGVSMIGLIMMAFGVSELIIPLTYWPLVEKFGRAITVAVAACVLILTIITFLLWKPNPQQVYVYFILICVWGTADSILFSTIYAAYGAFFEDNMEGAFSAATFWVSLGYLFWYTFSQFVCVNIKLYLIIASFIVSLVLYLSLEIFVIGKFKLKVKTLHK